VKNPVPLIPRDSLPEKVKEDLRGTRFTPNNRHYMYVVVVCCNLGLITKLLRVFLKRSQDRNSQRKCES